MSSLCPEPQLVAVGVMRAQGVTTQVFHYPNKYLYICIKMYFTAISRGRIIKKLEKRWGR
jgi:hypothetical protein